MNDAMSMPVDMEESIPPVVALDHCLSETTKEINEEKSDTAREGSDGTTQHVTTDSRIVADEALFVDINDKKKESSSPMEVRENNVIQCSHETPNCLSINENESNMDTCITSQQTSVDVTFFNNLNLLPRKRSRDLMNDDVIVCASPYERIKDSSSTDEQSISNETQSSSLVQLLQADPKQLLELLSKALSMDSLSDLLKQEHGNTSNQLESLREKLTKAQKTLTHCTEQKGSLLEQIDLVTDEIQKKRAQLQTAREELKELSMQEGSLRAKRDEANAKCSEIRRKLFASREALQQIQKLHGKRVKSSQKEYAAES